MYGTHVRNEKTLNKCSKVKGKANFPPKQTTKSYMVSRCIAVRFL